MMPTPRPGIATYTAPAPNRAPPKKRKPALTKKEQRQLLKPPGGKK